MWLIIWLDLFIWFELHNRNLTVHEFIVKIKLAKLQKLSIAFKTLKLEDNETFDDFYDKLSDIVNSSFYLGEIFPEHKVV